MPTYAFKGRNRMNELVVGERVADNRDELSRTVVGRSSGGEQHAGRERKRNGAGGEESAVAGILKEFQDR